MSLTSGLRSGLLSGLRSGLNPSYGANPMAGVAQDATSSKYLPATNAQWTTTMAAAGIGSGNPTSLWLCQEASGNLADSIAANTLTVFDAWTYQQAVTGWATKAVANSTANAAFFNVAIGDTTAGSVLFFGYVALVGTPAGARDVLDMGSGTGRRTAQATAAPVYQATGGGVQATGTGVSNPSTTVHPVILQVDRTNSAFRVITDQEIIAPAYTAPAGGGATLQIGDSGSSAASCLFVYLAYFSGAAAQMTTAQIRTLLQSLGWTVAW